MMPLHWRGCWTTTRKGLREPPQAAYAIAALLAWDGNAEAPRKAAMGVMWGKQPRPGCNMGGLNGTSSKLISARANGLGVGNATLPFPSPPPGKTIPRAPSREGSLSPRRDFFFHFKLHENGTRATRKVNFHGPDPGVARAVRK